MLPPVNFAPVLPEHDSSNTEKSTEVQVLKNQLNQYKLQNDLLGHQLENHRQQMSNVLQDKSLLKEELCQKSVHLRSLEAQVKHQTEQRDANLQKLADLNARVEYTQSRKQDAMKTLKLQSVLTAKTKQEVAFLEKRVQQERSMVEELKADMVEKKGDRQTERPPTVVFETPSSKSIGRSELMMLQEAHNEISSLTAQSEKLAQQIDTLKTVTDTLDIRKQIASWQQRSEELVKYIEENDSTIAQDQPRLLEICKGVFAGEYDDTFVDSKQLDGIVLPDATHPKKEPQLTLEQATAAKLLMPIVDSFLRPMRYLPGSNFKRTQAKRQRYMVMVNDFHENLLYASRNSENIVEALQKALTKGSFAMFRAHFARYRVERVWLRKMMLRQKCSFMGVTTKLKAMIRAKKEQFAAKKESYETTITELEHEVKGLMQELEVKSGSECSLRTIHTFYTTQMVWLQLVVERDEIDLTTLEEAFNTEDPSLHSIGMGILQKKKMEKAARCLQIQTGCLNVEKDIRLLEWEQKKQNPQAQWVSPNVRWTASGDSHDADTQTDTAYVLTQKLWQGSRSFQVRNDRGSLVKTWGTVEILLVTGEEFSARCMLDIGGSNTQLFFYGNLEHVYLPEEASSPRKTALPQTSDTSGATVNVKATTQTGIALANLLEIEYVRDKPRLRLTGQDERREEASRSVTYLELDCLYNDHQLYSCAIDINGVPFLATLVQCKKTKYGMCFVHVRIYQAITGWLRWCTLNARDFCRSLGFASITTLAVALGPTINDALCKYVVEAFKEDLAACDFYSEMASALPSLRDNELVSMIGLKFSEKAMMINAYTRLHGDREKQGSAHASRNRSKQTDMEANEEAQFKTSAQEVPFAKCIFSLDKDALASLTFQLEMLVGGDDDSPGALEAAQRAARRKMKKAKRERKRKRAMRDMTKKAAAFLD